MLELLVRDLEMQIFHALQYLNEPIGASHNRHPPQPAPAAAGTPEVLDCE